MRRCCMCGIEKPLSEFAFRSVATGELQSHCRACHAAYRRAHYLRNRDAYVQREAARIASFRIINRRNVFDYLSTHPCVDCGETDVVVLDFDHRDPLTKGGDIGFIAAHKPWRFVLAEIAKCDVRCANCHRKRTAIQFGWSARTLELSAPAPARLPTVSPATPTGEQRRCRRCDEVKPLAMFSLKNKKTGRRSTVCRACVAAQSRAHYYANKDQYLDRNRRNPARGRKSRQRTQAWLLEFLIDKSCVDCGETDPLLLEFDHRDGVDKEDAVTSLARKGDRSAFEAEIAKCDIRCANCHRRRTAAQFGWTKLALQRAAALARPEAGRDPGVSEPSLTYRTATTMEELAGVA